MFFDMIVIWEDVLEKMFDVVLSVDDSFMICYVSFYYCLRFMRMFIRLDVVWNVFEFVV